MNELEFLESMQMKTITDKQGKRHLVSVPITMHVNEEQKALIGDAKKFAIKYKGVIYAVVNEPEFYENRKEEVCARTFGSFSPNHAGAEPIMKQGEWLVSGASMHFTKRVQFDDGMDKYRFTPS